MDCSHAISEDLETWTCEQCEYIYCNMCINDSCE